MTVALHSRLMLSALFVLSTLRLVVSFTSDVTKWNQRTCDSALFAAKPRDHDDSLRDGQWDRRRVMEALGLSAITLSTSTSTASSATLPYDIACLLDLPPVEEDCVRIYICRHGETENNRLGKVQGARVDPPINYNGVQEAIRLGSALSMLDDACPSLVYHSNLMRAKETAEYVARTIVENAEKNVTLNELPTLGEVDFGSIAEGQPVSVARGGMIRTYGAWAAGYVDARGEGGGESGREVMTRATSTLSYLVKEAAENGGSVIGIAHSKFLKVLLSILDDVPLVQGTTTQQANCCIDVLDMKRDGSVITLGPKSNLVGGLLSNAPEDFSLSVPAGRIVRVNEKRHLIDLEIA